MGFPSPCADGARPPGSTLTAQHPKTAISTQNIDYPPFTSFQCHNPSSKINHKNSTTVLQQHDAPADCPPPPNHSLPLTLLDGHAPPPGYCPAQEQSKLLSNLMLQHLKNAQTPPSHPPIHHRRNSQVLSTSVCPSPIFYTNYPVISLIHNQPSSSNPSHQHTSLHVISALSLSLLILPILLCYSTRNKVRATLSLLLIPTERQASRRADDATPCHTLYDIFEDDEPDSMPEFRKHLVIPLEIVYDPKNDQLLLLQNQQTCIYRRR